MQRFLSGAIFAAGVGFVAVRAGGEPAVALAALMAAALSLVWFPDVYTSLRMHPGMAPQPAAAPFVRVFGWIVLLASAAVCFLGEMPA